MTCTQVLNPYLQSLLWSLQLTNRLSHLQLVSHTVILDASGSLKWCWIRLCPQIRFGHVHVWTSWPEDYVRPTSWSSCLPNRHQQSKPMYPCWMPFSYMLVRVLCPLSRAVKTAEACLQVGAENQFCGEFAHEAWMRMVQGCWWRNCQFGHPLTWKPTFH